MVHNVVQPDLIDSLATTHGYSYLLDMFSSPLFQLPEEEQLKHQEMCTEDGKCFNESLGQTSRTVHLHQETLSLDDNVVVEANVSGPPMDMLASEPTPPKRPRQKGLTWTQTEHELFLEGVEKYGRGDWKSIAKTFVLTRTPAQVASHAQKYFGRLKRCKNQGAGRRCKSMALKDSHSFPKPIIHSTICVPPSNYSIVHPTFYVPPSDNGNVPLNFSNPPMDFGKIPLSFTNLMSEESRKIGSTFSFPSADSTTFTCTDPFPQLKFPKVLPTIYAPPSNSTRVRVFPTIYVPPSDNDPFSEDAYQPSTNFITNPTSDNNIIHLTTYIPPSEHKNSDADLDIPSPNPITTPPSIETNVQPTISVPPSNDTPTNPDAYFPSLDFLNESCLGSISAPPTNPVSPLNSSFTNPDENPTLDFLDAPPLNGNSVVHQTLQVPPLNINTFDPTIPMPPNDLSYIHPAVSNLLTPEYPFTPSATTYQTLPTSPYDVAYMEQMFVEQHFLHQNGGFMEFMGM